MVYMDDAIRFAIEREPLRGILLLCFLLDDIPDRDAVAVTPLGVIV